MNAVKDQVAKLTGIAKLLLFLCLLCIVLLVSGLVLMSLGSSPSAAKGLGIFGFLGGCLFGGLFFNYPLIQKTD